VRLRNGYRFGGFFMLDLGGMSLSLLEGEGPRISCRLLGLSRWRR
jgi:hypothetical protein